jgi:hypothetical protein
MTREEMKKAIFRSQDDLVDYIFDNFESRTCESCKYHIVTNECEVLFTECSDEYDTFDVNLHTGKDFMCNKWEKKDD